MEGYRKKSVDLLLFALSFWTVCFGQIGPVGDGWLMRLGLQPGETTIYKFRDEQKQFDNGNYTILSNGTYYTQALVSKVNPPAPGSIVFGATVQTVFNYKLPIMTDVVKGNIHDIGLTNLGTAIGIQFPTCVPYQEQPVKVGSSWAVMGDLVRGGNRFYDYPALPVTGNIKLVSVNQSGAELSVSFFLRSGDKVQWRGVGTVMVSRVDGWIDSYDITLTELPAEGNRNGKYIQFHRYCTRVSEAVAPKPAPMPTIKRK